MLQATLPRALRCSRTHLTSPTFLRIASRFASGGSASPWFVEVEHFDLNTTPIEHPSLARRVIKRLEHPPLPAEVPDVIARLHAELFNLPFIDSQGLEVIIPPQTPPGPPLPAALPKGRRRRGGTEAGKGLPEPPGGIWKWLVLVQVKEGTENRGSIQSVIRAVRRQLLTSEMPISLPKNVKREFQDGWAVIDAGDFAVHILSTSARLKYFPQSHLREWEW